MPGTHCGPPQRRHLDLHAAPALRTKARWLHPQALLAATVGVRRRAVTAALAPTAAVAAVLLA
ncbi:MULTISPECIES: hypothetical protein [unclassified Arthrobacter]|uniref:hypothetical protein n=1 Tax=unclassified Arthrobacter TaxID=235627 RepID=UPI0028832BC6|nr:MULTISPECIES: hypothetical protein [unclassified Arthrobacter]